MTVVDGRNTRRGSASMDPERARATGADALSGLIESWRQWNVNTRCGVCGTPYREHGSYPTCASHPYTSPEDAARQADLARMAEEQRKANEDALHRLRLLRVWHYRQLLAARMHQRSCASSELARRYDAEAATHLGFVQSLNDFFELGDTAENDTRRDL